MCVRVKHKDYLKNNAENFFKVDELYNLRKKQEAKNASLSSQAFCLWQVWAEVEKEILV